MILKAQGSKSQFEVIETVRDRGHRTKFVRVDLRALGNNRIAKPDLS